ncbi:N-acetylmuramoyl-L-alanine amidase [Enterocloster bolteae]|uniref:N-acetylmuramoyl-L-alanine amidase n=2 Tax=Enterocloster bolteae TaxID=208479 RepID=UPI0034C31B29
MKRKIRERSAGCKSSGAPTDRIEHNGTARNKRRANGLAAIGLAGILAAGMGLTGCQNYESSSEMKARIQSEGGEASWNRESPAAVGASAVQGEGSADNGSTAETIKLDTERTTAPMPQFEDVSDTVYVKSSDGGSVRIRSACDTGDDSNILTYASPGTALKRTGKGEQWTRIDYNGTAGYISSGYITTQVPETAALPPQACVDSGEITLNPSWKYAEFSKINSGAAVLYRTEAASPKGITICVNAGHGTKGGASVKTQCHPDGTPKVTGGTTGAGATSAAAVSGGMTFADGTPESKVTLSMAKILKDKLLAAGYDVLMIRESDDVQLDNIARTVIANNASDCHIALHWDSTTNNKGAFYMSVPNVESYRSMEPVKSHWQQHNALGESLVAGLKGAGVKIFSGGSMAMDLTQTSFSTVPSVDIELGDKASDHSSATLATLADGLVAGVNQYFGQ